MSDKKQAEAGGYQAGLVLHTGRFGDDKDPNVGKDTQFKEGQSGNPAGRRKGKSLSKTIQEMLDDPGFIDRLSEKIKDKTKLPDPEFQSTPMKAMVATAIIESINSNEHPKTRADARRFLAQFGYGTKVDVTSKGERITDAPKIISIINARPTDASVEAETS
jgi:hypothetical protein